MFFRDRSSVAFNSIDHGRRHSFIVFMLFKQANEIPSAGAELFFKSFFSFFSKRETFTSRHRFSIVSWVEAQLFFPGDYFGQGLFTKASLGEKNFYLSRIYNSWEIECSIYKKILYTRKYSNQQKYRFHLTL